jgi:predicted RNase H-like nuclease
MGERKTDDLLERLHKECAKIAQRLKSDKIVSEIEVIKEVNDDKDFSLLAKSIRESIDKNEPEVALDRLHTYVMKFIRHLCENHKIEVNKDESLNAIFGKYVKFIVANDKIESLMTERILKYSIHVIEAFNDIRNNRSFAHDNEILNYSESVLIFNNVTNSIKFIESLEKTIATEIKKVEKETANWEDLPF